MLGCASPAGSSRRTPRCGCRRPWDAKCQGDTDGWRRPLTACGGVPPAAWLCLNLGGICVQWKSGVSEYLRCVWKCTRCQHATQCQERPLKRRGVTCCWSLLPHTAAAAAAAAAVLDCHCMQVRRLWQVPAAARPTAAAASCAAPAGWQQRLGRSRTPADPEMPCSQLTDFASAHQSCRAHGAELGMQAGQLQTRTHLKLLASDE